MSILEAKNLDICFVTGTGEEVHAVNNVSLSLETGEFLGLVGESGCGKSTIAKILMGLLRADGGDITVDGKELKYPYKTGVYREIQMIYQMPVESFNPRQTIGAGISDMLKNFGYNKAQAKERAIEFLDRVGLSKEYYGKYPHQMSGGECQRAAIARAFSINPKVVICDEVTSSLDVSVQAQVVELLLNMKESTNVAILFISHDLGLVQGLCDRVMVMYKGQIVESGTAQEVVHNPQNDYTKNLLASVLSI